MIVVRSIGTTEAAYMDFRILGPLEVSHNGRAVALGGPKQRALLALLLQGGNEVISSDRLIEDLWGERPPATAAKSLQVHISRLRKALQSDAENDVVLTRGQGYVIELGPDELDVRCFERLLDEGRRALAAGEPERAAPKLCEGLDLWRGPPLADFAYEPWAQTEIARLEELRLSAVEERLDADLALGRHADVTAELEGLVADNPLRERLRGQFMLALYRSGRQAQALEVYRAGRAMLVEELGIEPGPALRELERAVLEHDSVLDPPAVTPPAARSEGPPVPSPVLEERKLVTVLWVDLGADPRLESDPERLRDFQERASAAVNEELEAAGGRVERTLGGSVIATFGLPGAQEDHAERALHTALAARRRLADLFGEALSLRIGVESGEVIAGAEGDQAITGQPLVAAGRLVGGAPEGEIRVGLRTAGAVRGAFELDRVDGAHRLVRSTALVRTRGVRGLPQVFLGRESELEILRATYERVASQGRPHLATIVGDAGVGKTSLVRALRERLALSQGRWYVGRCLAYGRAITYHPMAEILKDRLGVLASDSPDVIRARLAERDILGLTLGLKPDEQLHPHEARERLHEALIGLLEEIASPGPAVVVIEDLHWAEPALLEFLGQAASDVRKPLLLIATGRPELLDRTSNWGVGRGDVSRTWLEPLSEADVERMLERLAGELPDAIRALVLQRAEGNPFFVEEVLASLLDQGVIRQQGSRWIASGAAPALEVADSCQAVVAARIDLLPPTEKRALQAAAVVGRSFWEGAVQALVDATDLDLRLLEERDFIRRSPHSSLDREHGYVFKHALTREVAYGSLPAGRKARAHADFAEWLEQAAGGDDDEHAPRLAHHYAEAVAPERAELAWAEDEARAAALRERAVWWLRRAGELAFSRYELADAAALYRHAVELEPDAAMRSELWAAAAQACMLRFDTDGFREAMEQAIQLRPPRAAAARLYAELGREGCRPYMWKHPPPRDVVERWIERALELAQPGSEASAVAIAAWAHLDPRGRSTEAREAVELAERLDEPTLLADAYDVQAKVATAQGRLAEAATYAARNLALVPRLADPDKRSAQSVLALFVYLRLARISDGRRAAQMHAELTARLTPHHEVHSAAFLLLADTIAGDWTRASGLSARAEAACAANADTPCQFNWRALLMAALAHAQLGNDHEARRLEELAGKSLTVHGPLAKEPALLRLALLRGDLEVVERLLAVNPTIDFFDVDYPAARLDALAAVCDRPGVEAEAARALDVGGYVEPFALRALGAVREERPLVERAATRFEQLGLAWRATETRALL
jgi:DNA-binding SARP family transcriptional activator/tetratricopeptide (TPR) repeat protein